MGMDANRNVRFATVDPLLSVTCRRRNPRRWGDAGATTVRSWDEPAGTLTDSFYAPYLLVEKVGQPQLDLRLTMLLAVGRGQGKVELERLMPGENVARLVGDHSQFDRLAGGE